MSYHLPIIDDDLGDGNFYKSTTELIEVLSLDSGPCAHCDKHLAKLHVHMHVNHNNYKYRHITDIYVHNDGSEPHPRDMFMRPKSQCPQCHAWGTIVTKQLAYNDDVSCSACTYHVSYSIGD